MSHTITVTLTEAAQRKALVAGQPAALRQTYSVTRDLIPRLLQLPWTRVSSDGEATCEVPSTIGYDKDLEPTPTRTRGRYTWCGGPCLSRPETAEAAIDHGELVLASYLGHLEDERSREERRRAEIEAEVQSAVDRWCALPLSWRAAADGVCVCVPPGADPGYRGPLTHSGEPVVRLDDLRRLAPDQLAEAEAEADRIRSEEEREAEERAAGERRDLRELLRTVGASAALVDAYDHGVASLDEVVALLRKALIGDLPQLAHVMSIPGCLGEIICRTNPAESVPSLVWAQSRRIVERVTARARELGIEVEMRVMLRRCSAPSYTGELVELRHYLVELRAVAPTGIKMVLKLAIDKT